ncbi:MAG: hypothetical protein IJ591_00020 [Lachnospiraceae bacterium]|nr:hypothetical protein [Lachnospiraceae bacterium]
MKNNLFLFSDSFPYGNEERTFILPELEWMKEVFDVTVISSVNTADSNQKVESPL